MGLANGAGLTPDRDSVSSQAVAVWNKYEKRGDVDRQQMDVDHKLGGDREWLQNFDQLTPKIRVDDCDQSAALNYAGANSQDGIRYHYQRCILKIIPKSSTP